MGGAGLSRGHIRKGRLGEIWCPAAAVGGACPFVGYRAERWYPWLGTPAVTWTGLSAGSVGDVKPPDRDEDGGSPYAVS